MAAIEFTSSPGKSFTVVVRNPASSYASLATGIACTEIAATRYRATVGSLTGVVWIEATAGATKAVGFSDLDNPEPTGYSEVTDERPSHRALMNGVIAGLSSIEPTVITNYDPRKRQLSLIQRDDYSTSSGTHIDMQINIPSGVDPNACTVKFSMVLKGDTSSRRDLTLTLRQASGDYFIVFQATSAQMNIPDGQYDWQATIFETGSGRRVTVINGAARVDEAQVR